MTRRLTLALLEDRLSICRLSASEGVPAWAATPGGGFHSITWTADEVSIVCREGAAPEGVRWDGGWRVFKIEGPFDFAETGILLAVAEPLKLASIGIFAVSTFDTDYVLVKAEALEAAIEALVAAGHQVNA